MRIPRQIVGVQTDTLQRGEQTAVAGVNIGQRAFGIHIFEAQTNNLERHLGFRR